MEEMPLTAKWKVCDTCFDFVVAQIIGVVARKV